MIRRKSQHRQDCPLALRPQPDRSARSAESQRPENSDPNRAANLVVHCWPRAARHWFPGRHQPGMLAQLQPKSGHQSLDRSPPRPQRPALLQVAQRPDAQPSPVRKLPLSPSGREPVLTDQPPDLPSPDRI